MDFPFDQATFRTGLFALQTARFGRVSELLIQRLTGAGMGRTRFHDLFHVAAGERLEVKVSRVQRKHPAPVDETNVIEIIMAEGASRAVLYDDRAAPGIMFDCNIQQVKPAQFDRLYYGLFFYDRVAFFSVVAGEVANMPGWSNRQHIGNEGEGQFHLTNRNVDQHVAKYLANTLTYEEFRNLLAPS